MNIANISNVLLTGNGFDLYLGFKTKYSDFLKSINIINEELNEADYLSKIVSLLEVNIDNSTLLKYKNEVKKLIGNNYFLDYFISFYNSELTWADFEIELENIIKTFDSLLTIFKNHDYSIFDEWILINQNETRKMDYVLNFNSDNKHFIYTNHYMSRNGVTYSGIYIKKRLSDINSTVQNFVKKISNNLYEDLYALETIFAHFLNMQYEETRFFYLDYPEKMSFLITYNYTMSAKLIASENKTDTFNIYYINGRLYDNAGDLNLIFGIDSSIELKNNSLRIFCKSLQRLNKHTAYRITSSMPTIDVLHVFGFSFPPADADSIKEIISHIRKRIKIYYKVESNRLDEEHNKNIILSNLKSIYKGEFEKLSNMIDLIPANSFFIEMPQ